MAPTRRSRSASATTPCSVLPTWSIEAVKAGADAPLLPHRRLRWRALRPQLLHRARRSRFRSDCVILTLACGKFRFNKLEFGEIGGLPRLLDIGQCNDTYSALKIALALSKAFECGVNDLPLSLVLVWYEQRPSPCCSRCFTWACEHPHRPTLPAFLSPSRVSSCDTRSSTSWRSRLRMKIWQRCLHEIPKPGG